MKRKVYIHQLPLSEEIIQLFSNINENIIVEQIEENFLTIIDDDFYNEEPINMDSFKELIFEDFGEEIRMFIEPYSEKEFELGKQFKELLPHLPSNVYFFEDIIPYVILKQQNKLRKQIIDYITNITNKEVVHTVKEFIENNLNSSQSAKKLFMHRNTLNYRLDNFIEATNINVRTFKGANAIYMLFKY